MPMLANWISAGGDAIQIVQLAIKSFLAKDAVS